MSGRLATDLGTSNTVVAIWDEAREEGVSLHIPDISQPMQYEKCYSLKALPQFGFFRT